MAENIKVGIELTSNTAEETKKVQALNKELETAKKIAGSTAAGRAAVQSAPVSRSASGSTDREDFRVARSGVGTGAEGRDFAKQAQGLGGLVHVYATFAANIFAVSAAFMALDKAYSVIRLEKAAEIMSNKIGFSVQRLSKDLQSATGHAISFQEAMQFSAMGISAGLTGKQITDLTIMAKGAANALGRDMGDAVRRMITGTAKQEQEILDELGIFVRAKTAYAEYAKKLNVGADELTATQRVQAYAEAVSKAGEKWRDFATIDDPFSRFTATAKEAGVELLNTINAIITPLMNLLSQSKSLMEGILLVTVAKLGTMALPHLGESLKSMFTVDKAAIDKQIAGFNLLVTEKQKAIEKLHLTQVSTGSGIKKAYKELDQDGAKFSTGILPTGAAFDSMKELPTDKTVIKEKLSTMIIKGIKSDEQVKQAIEQQILKKGSTLDNIVVNQNTLNSLATKAVRIGEEQNVALLRYKLLKEEILTLEHALIAEQAGQADKLNNTKFANQKLQAEAASKAQGIAGQSDIGWLNKGGDPGKFKLIFDELGQSISKSTGFLGTFGAMFSAFGTVASIALNKIMVAVPYLMVLFAAFETVIKPVWDHFHTLQNKVTESSAALLENSIALKNSFDAFNKFSDKSNITGEGFLQALEAKATALLQVKDGISKLITDLEAKQEQDTGKKSKMSQVVYGVTGFGTGGPKDVRVGTTEASEGLKSIDNILQKTSVMDKETKAVVDLQQVYKEMYTLESRAMSTGHDKITTTKEYIDLLKRGKDALELYNIQEQIKASNLNGILAPSKAAAKAIDDYINKSHEATTKEITDMGIKDPLLQKSYRDTSTALRNLVNNVDDASRKSGANSMFLEMANNLLKVKGMAAETKLEIQALFAAIESPNTSKEDKTILAARVAEINKKLHLTIQDEHKVGGDDAKAAEQKRWQIQAEGRALEIRGMQHALKVSDEQAAIEEKVLGFKTGKTIEMSKQHNMDIAQKTFDSQKLELERKLKEEGSSPKAKENTKLAISQAKELMQHTKMQAELKAQMEHGAATMQQYELTTGADAKRQIATIDNLQKIADLNGLLNEEDKIKNENKLLQLDLDRQIASEMKRQSTFVGATAADEKSKSDKVLADLESKKSYGNALEKAKLDKKERDDKVKDNVTYIKLYDMQIAKIHEGAVTKAKADEAEMIRAKKLAADSIKTQQEILNITLAEHDAEMRNAQIQILLIEKKKTAEAEYQQRLLDRQKTFGTDTRAQQFQTAADMVNNEAERFGKTLTPAVTTVFKAIYGGMDAAIDTLTTKWMKGEKFVVRDVVAAFRNTMAEQFRQASAEQMKMAGRQLMQAGSVALSSAFGMKPEISKQDAREAVLDTQFGEMKTIALQQLEAQQAIKKASEDKVAADAKFSTPGGMSIPAAGDTAFNRANPTGSSFSGSGTSGQLTSGIGSLFGSAISGGTGGGLLGGVAGKVAGAGITGGLNWLQKAMGFANGGIMTPTGSIPLHAYASGGVASTPQMALFGEGRMNEAYVPLPDGRSIPVSMKGPTNTNSSPNGPISVSVQVNTTTGQTNTQAKGGGNTDAMAQFGTIIAQKVREEIIQQSRPNGLLNR